MAPVIPSAKLTVSYPLFAADFNPRNSDYLVVGGGGGEGRSGVGNRLVSIPLVKKRIHGLAVHMGNAMTDTCLHGV